MGLNSAFKGLKITGAITLLSVYAFMEWTWTALLFLRFQNETVDFPPFLTLDKIFERNGMKINGNRF